MAGKAAAGEKKRGRPRKNKGLPPLSPPPASVEARCQAAPPPGPPPPAPPAPPARRSHRPRRPPRMDDYADYGDYVDDFYCEYLSTDEEAGKGEVEYDEEESEGAERSGREKKFKLLQKLPNHHNRSRSAPPSSSSSSGEEDGAGGGGLVGKGRGGGVSRGDDGADYEYGDGLRWDGSGGGELEDGGRHAAPKCDHSASGRTTDHRPLSTPLPDKKMLEAVLDKLQKKDIYGVYAEPVDPEELPDYHDIIKHPMDFGTIRRKLVAGVYCNLEQFESDVFLVCTNAMQYNAPDTIYFRQARSIQELARKKFQSMRFDSEDVLSSEQKTQSNSMTRKARRKSLCKSAHISDGSDLSLVATCISTGDACGTGHNAEQPCPAEQTVGVNGHMDSSLTCENKSEKGDEHSAKGSPVELERKPDMLHEDRRATYDVSSEQPVIQSDSLFTTFESEQRHLIAVGLDTQYSYARSLARFAGTLGPIAWKIASEKIEKALPAGIKFGPGWVGECEPLPAPVHPFGCQSGYNNHFLCKTEYLKERAEEDELKSAKSVAKKGLQLDNRVPLDSSKMGVSNGKMNQIERPFCPRTFDQSPSTRNLSTDVSSFKSESVVGMAAQRYQQCSEVTISGVPEMISVGRSNKRSEIFKQPELVCSQSESTSSVGRSNKRSEMFKQPELVCSQSESTSSSVDNRSLSSGKETVNFGGSVKQSIYSGPVLTNQARVLGNHFSRGEHEQAIGDPIELMSNMPGRKMVDGNPKQLTSAVPLSRSNYVAAVPITAPVWMSVGRSSMQKVREASDHLKMQAGGASLGNLCSASLASVSGYHDNNEKTPTSFMPQLPTQAVGEECWVQRKSLSVFPQFIATELSRSRGQGSLGSLSPKVQKQKKDMCPPDLNITFHAPKSPGLQSPGILVDSQQPDLALQL